MPTNLQASIRYKILNDWFRDQDRYNDLDMLAEACAKANKKNKVPSERTINGDIAEMKSGRLGYIAPIEYEHGRGYHYTNPKFSIHDFNLSEKQSAEILQSFHLLKQLTHNAHLAGVHDSIALLEKKFMNNSNPKPKRQYIFFEESTNFDGHHWIDDLYDFCVNSKTCRIYYRPFTYPQEPETKYVYSPFYIKEYNSRWYIIAYCHDKNMMYNIALDRIESIDASLQPYAIQHLVEDDLLHNEYIGVTRGGELKEIMLRIAPESFKYLESKPLHKSQQIHNQDQDGWTQISLKLRPNYEFYYKIRAYGPTIELISPPDVRDKMTKIVQQWAELYRQDG